MKTESTGKKELKILHEMVTNWKNSYARMPNDGKSGWEFLADDLGEDIRRDLIPYVERLCKTEYITEVQKAGFYGWCVEQVELLREELKSPEQDWVTLSEGGFNGHKTGDS